jgi:hypothetical protein
MNRLQAIAAAVPLLAFAAAAQDGPLASQVKVMSLRGGVIGKTVKGAPYSATEVTETNQTLADGTHINNQTQTQVWRDSEGRVRRETGNEVMIYDPVAGFSYSLNTKTQTARKLPLGTYMFSSNADGSKTNMQYFRFSTDGSADVKKELEAAQLKSDIKLSDYKDAYKAELDMAQAKRNMETVTLETARTMKLDAATAKAGVRSKAVGQSLGKRMMEGVNADGTSETSTIEAGAIGNDRPIQSTSERWFSSDLQTVMMSRHNDPRTGEETFKLINVSRTEPPSYLFQVPAGYQTVQ